MRLSRSSLHSSWLGPLLALALATAAPAALPPASAGIDATPAAPAIPSCACEEERGALVAWRERIAAAPDLEAARDLALSQTRRARRALRSARWLAPGSERIARAHERLVAYEARVERAETPAQAAAEFGELVQLASLGPVLADVEIDLDDGGCDYSTGEIIAIVLGFILGIIPGIILLILLC